jgi:hypothetical protein
MRLSLFAVLFASAVLTAPAVEAQGRPRPPAPGFSGSSNGSTSTTAPPVPPPFVPIPPSLFNAGAAAGNLSLTTQSTPGNLKVNTGNAPKNP